MKKSSADGTHGGGIGGRSRRGVHGSRGGRCGQVRVSLWRWPPMASSSGGVCLHDLPDSVKELRTGRRQLRHRRLHLIRRAQGLWLRFRRLRWRRGTGLGQGDMELSVAFSIGRWTKDGSSGEEAICWAWPI
jgi:hypothetical protein